MDKIPVTRATVLISGEGSNLQALIEACKSQLGYLNIVRVISNRLNANGLNRAKAASIPTSYHNLISGKYYGKGEKDQGVIKAGRMVYDHDLAKLVLADKPHIVICAGFMHVFSPSFLDPIKQQQIPVINLHPALYGKYDGANAIQRAYDDFRLGKLENNKTGIMIHYVISEVDRGDPIIQREIECVETESLRDFENRVHQHEHQLIVEGTSLAVQELWKNRLNE